MFKVTIYNEIKPKARLLYEYVHTYETKNIINLKETLNYYINNKCLNIPYDYSSDIELKISDKLNYILFKFTTTDLKSTLEYFKNYNTVIANRDEIYAGLIEIEQSNLKELKVTFEKIKSDLKEFTEFKNILSKDYKTKLFNYKVIFQNSGKVYPKILGKVSDFYITPEVSVKFKTNTFSERCFEVYKALGFYLESEENEIRKYIKDNDEYFLYLNNPSIMNHKNSTKSLNIFKIVARSFHYKLNDNDFSLVKCNNTINSKFLTENSNITDKFFFNKQNITICSPMGTGKSKNIKQIIDKFHDLEKRILIVTPRISIARELKAKFNELKLYLDNDYKRGDSLICQFDSLHHFGMENFDVVIFDEFYSLMLHSRNPAKINSKSLFKFLSLYNKKMIISDAFLSNYQQNIINFSKTKHIFNNFKDKSEVLEIENKELFFNSIKDEILNNPEAKITISVTSNKVIYELQEFLLNLNKKVRILTADTLESTKELIYDKFKLKNHDYWDVLIYSPVLTVGVSNINETEAHFHYECSKSIDIISSIQMVKRTRSYKKLYYFIDDRKINKITDFESIKNQYFNNVSNSEKYDKFFTVNKFGDRKLSSYGELNIKLDLFMNILECNRKDTFDYILKNQFKINKSIDNNLISEKNNFEISNIIYNNSEIEKLKKELNFDITDFDNINKLNEFFELLKEKKNLIKQIKKFKLLSLSKKELKHLYDISLIENKENSRFLKLLLKNSITSNLDLDLNNKEHKYIFNEIGGNDLEFVKKFEDYII